MRILRLGESKHLSPVIEGKTAVLAFESKNLAPNYPYRLLQPGVSCLIPAIYGTPSKTGLRVALYHLAFKILKHKTWQSYCELIWQQTPGTPHMGLTDGSF